MEIQSNSEITSQKLCVAGISHKSADLPVRQIFQIGRKELPDCLASAFGLEQVSGIVILATCNRIEFYMTTDTNANPLEIIRKFYKAKINIDIDSYRDAFYLYDDSEAVSHLFRVISGLESLVFGEYQIMGQIRDAYSTACEAKTVDKTLHKLFHAAFRTGKKVRTQTSIGEGKQSVSGVASQIAVERLSQDSTVCIIGVNENSRIFAQSLKDTGFRHFIFVNRTLYKAQALANDFGGRAIDLESVVNALYESDAVFSSTGASGYVVGSGMLHLLHHQGYCPRLIIDAAVPRDIDTTGLPKEIDVWDMQQLQRWLENEQNKKLHELPAAEQFIAEETAIFKAWADSLNNPILNPYAERFEQIRQQLMQENRHLLSGDSFETADRMTKSLMHRLQSTFIRMIIKNQENNGG